MYRVLNIELEVHFLLNAFFHRNGLLGALSVNEHNIILVKLSIDTVTVIYTLTVFYPQYMTNRTVPLRNCNINEYNLKF